MVASWNLPTREGWRSLAVIRDRYPRRVVGWSMAATLERALVVHTLHHARIRRQPNTALVHHSDRGSQYARSDYQGQRAIAQIKTRMSRKGNCWDNAVMERFSPR